MDRMIDTRRFWRATIQHPDGAITYVTLKAASAFDAAHIARQTATRAKVTCIDEIK
jgi:hypothetical protein